MIIKIGFDIQFELAGPTPMVLMLFVHPSRRGDLCIEEKLNVDPKVPVTPYVDMYGNLCGRVLAPAGKVRFTLDTLIKDTGKPDVQTLDAVQHRVEDLPDSTLVFLLASRYCEVDKLNDMAWKLFGATSPGWPAHRSGSTHTAGSPRGSVCVFRAWPGLPNWNSGPPSR